MARVDVGELRDKVKVMYKAVAQEPHGTFHFEMGRVLAERLGYPAEELDQVPPEAIESFAGVGYHLGLAAIAASERVVDLGSGSGMDAFVAARHAGAGGRMAISDIVTERQLTEAIVCDVNLWASCIGGAMQEDEYRRAIEDAGLGLVKAQENPGYHFISDSAQGATKTFGVKSISILAAKR